MSICRFVTNMKSISSQLAAGSPNAQFGKTEFLRYKFKFKYFHIFSNTFWGSPPGMFAGCWGGCSLVNNIKGREVEKQTGWMQKTRSQLLRHMFQMESLLLFPPVLRQRFRAGRQFLKGKISLESKNADGKMSFNKDSVFVHVLTNEILNQPLSPIAFKRYSA